MKQDPCVYMNCCLLIAYYLCRLLDRVFSGATLPLVSVCKCDLAHLPPLASKRYISVIEYIFHCTICFRLVLFLFGVRIVLFRWMTYLHRFIRKKRYYDRVEFTWWLCVFWLITFLSLASLDCLTLWFVKITLISRLFSWLFDGLGDCLRLEVTPLSGGATHFFSTKNYNCCSRFRYEKIDKTIYDTRINCSNTPCFLVQVRLGYWTLHSCDYT